ncbi:MAG: LCP family protein [Bacillota bacterium]|nr:LCP family protein [Bacillota bacterium]
MVKREKLKRKIKLIPESTVMCGAFVAGGFSEVLFLMLVLALDVLPFKYLSAMLIFILVLDVIIVYLANSKSKHGTRRIGALVLILLILNVLVIGDSYVYSTYDTLEKISKSRAIWQVYDVVALKEGDHSTIDSISGKKVYAPERKSKELNEAKERLVTKSDVSYAEETNIIDLGKKLVGEEGELNDEIALMTKEDYGILSKQIQGFKKNTEVIYTIKVKKRSDDGVKAVDVTEDSFNILISGKDVWGKLKDKDGLSDVNMVMTVNPETKKILLTSIPRDSYISLHTYGAKDKLTHTGIYGADETRKTIEDFLEIDINYSITVNFSMLVDLVEAIDGIDVYSDYTFKSALKEYHYIKGWNHVGGWKALYFARERKAFTEGDMQRNKNQQIVLKAIIDKVTNSRVIMTKYTKILNAVEDEMYTDMSDKDLKKLAKLTLRDMKHGWKVESVNITGGTGGAPCFSMGNQNLSCVFPNQESVDECKKAIHDCMYPVDNTLKKDDKKDGNTNGK